MSDAYRTETRNYWRAARMLTDEMRKPAPDADRIEDAVSELEVIVLYTDRPTLRAAAQRMMSRLSNGDARAAHS